MIEVVLVDKNDRIVGFKEKFAAHKNPVPLHRAISVVIYSDDKKRILLQKRAKNKPTWPLFWSNTVCSHPFKNETYLHAAKRRLKEEMRFSAPLRETFRFVYKAEMDKTWGEHEYDVVFEGVYEGPVDPDPNEAEDFKWMGINDLKEEIKQNPQIYTPWFKIICDRLL